MGFPLPPWRRAPSRWGRVLATLLCAFVVLGVAPTAARADTADPGAAAAGTTWSPPVPGRVVRPFSEPANQFAAGHRGVDFAAPAGAAVRAAGAGTVAFAGDVAGSLHVVVAHTNGLRTSYSFLLDVSVHVGQTVARGDVVGHAGGTDEDHAVGVLFFGLRVGDRYVDPMVLFRPRDLTELVRLVPAGERPARPWVSPTRERAELALGLAFKPRSIAPSTVAPPGGAAPAATLGDAGGGCGDGIPVIGDAVSTACDAVVAAGHEVIDWTATSVAAALDLGLSVLHHAGRIGAELVARLRDPLHGLLVTLRDLSEAPERALLATPLGKVASDLVKIGLRIWDWTQRECSKDAPPADGTGGDGHLLMAVGGIDSHTFADGRSFGLDTKALGYSASDVTWFSYADDGGKYDKVDTHGDLVAKAALLGQQLEQMRREHPGKPVDLIAHSQGGVVVDWFLVHIYKQDPAKFPPLDTVVTLSSPHQGAPLATAGEQLRRTAVGRNLTRIFDEHNDKHPPSGSTAVQELAEDSWFMDNLFVGGLPDKIHVTSIGASDDWVVPADHISVPGGQEIVVDVGGVEHDHTEIPHDPNALRAVRAALDHKPLPCTSLLDSVRGALEPVVISAASHDLGNLATTLLKGPGPL